VKLLQFLRLLLEQDFNAWRGEREPPCVNRRKQRGRGLRRYVLRRNEQGRNENKHGRAGSKRNCSFHEATSQGEKRRSREWASDGAISQLPVASSLERIVLDLVCPSAGVALGETPAGLCRPTGGNDANRVCWDYFRLVRLSANDQQTLGDIALLIWPFTSTRRLPEVFL
jgi:hypothetical protein